MNDPTAHDEQYSKKLRGEFKSIKKRKDEIVIIAGAAGFVGSRIAESLVDVGLKVIGIDNFVSGREQYLERLVGKDNFELIEADLMQGLPEVLFSKKISYIIDALDVYPHVGRTEFGLTELLNNSVTLRNLLSFANQMKARIIFTSSVDIYQGLASHEYLQNYYDGKELTSYYEFLEGKRYGEALCREYVDKFNLDVRVARVAEVYGPRMDIQGSSILSRAIRLALSDKDLIFDEEGSQQHQLIYIDDFIYGLLKLLFSDDEKIHGGIFYFINTEPVSTLSIAYTLKELVGKDLKVEFIPRHRKVGLPSPQKIDIGRTMKLLKWSPKIPLTEGLELTLKWFVEAAKSKEVLTHTLTTEEMPVPIPIPMSEVPEEVAPTLSSIEPVVPEASLEEDVAATPEPYIPQPKVDAPSSSQQLDATEFAVEPSSAPTTQPQSVGEKEALPVIEVPSEVSPPVTAAKPQQHKKVGWLSLVSRKANTPKRLASLRSHISLNFNIRGLLHFWPEYLMGVILFLVLVSIPLLISMGLAWQGAKAFRDYNFKKSEELLYQSSSLYKYYKAPARWFGLSRQYDALDAVFEVSVATTRLAQESQATLKSLSPMAEFLQASLVGDKSVKGYSVKELYSMVDKSLADYYVAKSWFSLVDQGLNEIELDDLPKGLRSDISNSKEIAWLFAPLMNHGDEFLRHLDLILGFDRPKRYIVWLQNSNEIRPTGGFIGSYMAITLNEGKVTDFKIDDIYNPDGLLGKHEFPVDDIMKKFFKTNNLWIRDTNWWVDFPTSAEAFTSLYEKATKEKVDGVVSFNLSTAEDLLKNTGPITINSYKETVTSENLFLTAEQHAEISYEPGSTNKRDFLGALFEAVMAKLVSGDTGVMNGVVKTIGENVLSRDITFYFNNEDLEKSVKDMKIAGVMLDEPGSDYIKIVDSNIGINKVNDWVRRSTNYSVDVTRDGYLQSTLEISWENTAENNTWPHGEYVNYVRVYVPENVSVVKVTPELDEYSVKKEFGRTAIAGVVRVPVKEKTSIKVTYLLPKNIQLGDDKEYKLIWEPQPGLSDEDISFSLNLPVFLKSDEHTSFERKLNWPIYIDIPVTRS